MRCTTRRFRRRGVAAMLAMLYLVLFSTLVLGFYAAATTQSQVVKNDERSARAQMAAESGMDFIRYQLARVSIPPGTLPANVTTALCNDLQAQLEGTGNLGAQVVDRDGSVISIPRNQSAFIKLDPAGAYSFNATITDWPDQGKIVVKTTGKYLDMTRAIQMEFTRVPKEETVFDNAVASKGQIVMQKGAITSLDPAESSIATVMSALGVAGAIQVSGGVIGGKLTILDTATALITGGTVAGDSIPAVIQAQDVNTVTTPPEFPTFDPTVYRPYATTAWVDGKNLQKNIYIPANSGTPVHPVTFNANDTVQGILYVESPNCVKFNGSFDLQGFLVMAASASTTDNLDFRGNLSQLPLPSGSQFDAIRAATGISVLAPNASVTMSGSTDSLLKGSVICDTFDYHGSADVVIDHGTLMTYKAGPNSAVFSGKTIKFTATGTNNLPTVGMTFSQMYAAEPTTYEELLPE